MTSALTKSFYGTAEGPGKAGLRLQYATGLICAVNIANKLVNHDENQKEKYLKFLSSGSIKSPIALLKSCGCDLEKEEIYDDVFAVCKDFIRKWEALL